MIIPKHLNNYAIKNTDRWHLVFLFTFDYWLVVYPSPARNSSLAVIRFPMMAAFKSYYALKKSLIANMRLNDGKKYIEVGIDDL